MTLLAPSVGEVALLANALNVTTPEALTLRIYINNHAPTAADTAASYTEASGNGYAAVAMTRAGWTVTNSTPSYATYAQQTTSWTGTVTVYGYFITGTTSGTLYWAEEIYPSGQVFNSGDTLAITPKITLT